MSQMSFKDPITGETIKLDNSHFTAAGTNIKDILEAVKGPISDIGASEGWFSDSDFENGMEAIRGLGSEMVNLAEGVKQMSILSFVDPLDPNNIVKLEQVHFDKAGENIKSILEAVKSPIENLGKSKWWKSSDFKNGLETLHGTSDELMKLTESMIEIQKLQSSQFSAEDSGKYLTGVVKAFTGPFDGGKLKASDAKTITGSYRKMIDDVVKLAKNESKLGKVASHLESISDSMVKVVSAFDKISSNKLEASKEFFESLVAIEKINADTFKAKLQQTEELISATDKVKAVEPVVASNAKDKDDERMAKLEDGFSKMQELLAGLYEIMGNINTTLQSNTLKVDVVSMDKDINL